MHGLSGFRAAHRTAALLACALAAAGCDGPQSTLVPAGTEARDIATLFWWMTGGTAVIWGAVVALSLYAGLRRGDAPVLDEGGARKLVLWAGAIVPTVVIAALLAWGLMLLAGRNTPVEGALRVAVTGEMYWWRVHYQRPDGAAPVPLANELWLPVDAPTELQLDAPDVIHSFWVPSLAGKMDTIPGRLTRLRLDPTQTGDFRGACAEYCGGSHAFMGFHVRVVPRPDFERWLAAQAAPAVAPAGALEARGAELFLAHGCGACHTVRGTDANGTVGPDLTHVGSRQTLAATRLPNTREGFRDWLVRPSELKPGVRMPHYGMLPGDELDALAAYLEGLQ